MSRLALSNIKEFYCCGRPSLPKRKSSNWGLFLVFLLFGFLNNYFLLIFAQWKKVAVTPLSVMPSANLMTELATQQQGEWIKVGKSAATPCKRQGHRAVSHSGNMFLFGGFTDDGLCPNTLFRFQFRMYPAF